VSSSIERLGKNINGYFGERIDIQRVLRECVDAARAHGWSTEFLDTDGHGRTRTDTDWAVQQTDLLTMRRTGGSQGTGLRVYISAGIHGDEPAGPLAVLQLLKENQWPANIDFWMCPCLNPSGFELNRRENRDGIDLNRQYHHATAAETRAHIGWLQHQPDFHLCLCLHEDWEAHGFYVYELNPDQQPSLAEGMVAAVADVGPIDRSEIIEGRAAQNGIIRPSVDPRSRPQWPEAFYLLTHKTRLSYTLEAPSDFPLSVRVAAVVRAVRTAIEIRARNS